MKKPLKNRLLRIFFIAFILGAFVLPSLPSFSLSLPIPDIKSGTPVAHTVKPFDSSLWWSKAPAEPGAGSSPAQAPKILGEKATITDLPKLSEAESSKISDLAGLRDKLTGKTGALKFKSVAFTYSNNYTPFVYAVDADDYWVGGSGSWSQASTHWASSDGGTPGAGHLPGATTNTHFTNLSNATAYTVTIDSAATCANMTWALPGSSGVPTFASSSGALNITGALTNVAAMLWTATVLVTFSGTAGPYNITSAGVSYANPFAFSGGAGGSWSNVDALNDNANTITLVNGTWNTNGQTITSGSFTTNAGTSALTLGATVWNCGGNWTATNLGTLTAGTSSIRFTSAATQFTGAGKTYYEVQFNSSGAAAVLDLNTFTNLTRTGTAVVADTIVFSANETIGTFTVTGNSVANRVAVKSNTTSARTLTVTTNVMTNADFYYINGGGAASWNFSGNTGGSADMGGNVNLTLTSTAYWVGGSGTVSDGTNHWSGVSAGSPHADFTPLTNGTISLCFDGNSGFTGGSHTVTWLSGTTIYKNLDWTGAPASPIMAMAGNYSLRFAGNVTLISTLGYTSGFSGDLDFCTNGSGTTTFTPNGNTFGPGSVNMGIVIGAAGGTVNLAGNINSALPLAFSMASLNQGAYTITQIGGATFGGGTGLNFTGLVTLTTVIISGSSTYSSLTLNGNLTGNTVTLSAGNTITTFTDTVSALTGLELLGSNTFGTFTLTCPASFLKLDADQTITGSTSISSTSPTSRVLVQSNTQGTLRAINTPSITSTSVDWSDIQGTGAASWNLSSGNNGDAGGNIGITFTNAANIYWVGNNGYWTDQNHWSTTSGGSGGARVPLIQDTAIVDTNSLPGGPNNIILQAGYRMSSINTSTAGGNNPLFVGTTATFYGSLINLSGSSYGTVTGTTYIYSRNNTLLTMGGAAFAALVIGQGTTNGTVTLQDDNLSNLLTLTLLAGSLNLNGHTLTAGTFDTSTTTYARTINMGSGSIILNSVAAGTKWNAAATNLTINKGTSTITLTSSQTNTQTFAGGGLTYNNVTISGAGDYQTTITGANTFNILKIDRSQAHKTVSTTAIQTFTSLAIPISGTTTVTLTGTSSTYTSAAGVFTSDYLVIDHSTANGGATFYAGSHSTNGGSNSGWLFSDPGGPFPTATSNAASAITNTGAQLNGALTNIGSYTPLYGYFQYDLDGTYVAPVSTSQKLLTSNTSFIQTISGLTPNVLYHYRAVVIYNISTYSYGTDTTFTTSGAPTVTTGAASNISNFSATMQGTITSMGTYSSVSVYFEYGTTGAYGTSTSLQPYTSAITFTQPLTGLNFNTLYYFRADLSYNGGTVVNGSQQTFTTTTLTNPAVVTLTAGAITTTSATLQGQVTSMGSYSTVAVFFEWGLTTSYGSVTADTNTTTVDIVGTTISGLTAATGYHFRANVRYNNGAIINGSDQAFSTSSAAVLVVVTNAVTNVTAISATLQGTLTGFGTYSAAYVYFEYGTDTSYGSTTAPQLTSSLGVFNAAITGLANNVTYHIQAIAVAGVTPVYGGDVSFTAGQGSNWIKIVSGTQNANYWNMVGAAPSAPSNLYTELGTGFLFGSWLQAFSNTSQIPLALIIFPWAFGWSLALGLLAYVLTMGKAGKNTGGQRPWRGSLPVMAFVSALSMTYFVIAGGGAIPGWTLIPFFIWAFATILFRQNQEGRGW